VIFRAIGPGYFSTMGIPLVGGRDFNDQDTLDTTLAVVVSEKTADIIGRTPIRSASGSETARHI